MITTFTGLSHETLVLTTQRNNHQDTSDAPVLIPEALLNITEAPMESLEGLTPSVEVPALIWRAQARCSEASTVTSAEDQSVEVPVETFSQPSSREVPALNLSFSGSGWRRTDDLQAKSKSIWNTSTAFIHRQTQVDNVLSYHKLINNFYIYIYFSISSCNRYILRTTSDPWLRLGQWWWWWWRWY